MRAAWYESNGPAHEVFTVGEVEDPRAGPGEVRVRLSASGVNPSDVKRRSGWGGQRMQSPRIVPHSDGAGVIDEVGPGVPDSRLEERVWVYNAQWKRDFGTAAELITLPAEQAVRLPDQTDFSAGACLGIPGMTAHRCVFADGPVSGQTVFVAGGAGSVGFYAVQLARWGGAQVLATVSSDQKARIARDAGANEVINYRSEDVAARVMQLTDRAGVDRVIEVDYAANVATNTAILKQGGVIASYASMSEREPPIPFYQMMQKNLLTRLVFVYEVPKPALAQAASDLNACQKEGSLKHLIDRRFPLNQTAQAHEAVESGQMIGNVVIDI